MIVDFYRESGFLPEAILNYLLLLGWSLDDQHRDPHAGERIAHFTLERVNKSAASFDPKKLLSFEERYMQALPLERRVELALPFLERAGWIASPAAPAERGRVGAIVAAAGERIKVAGDVLDYDEFFVADAALVYDEKAFDKRLRNAHEAPRLLAELAAELRADADADAAFAAAALESRFQAFVAARGLGLGAIVHAVRVAVSGKAVGFGLFDLLAILGRERVLARLDRALARLAPVRQQA